jgi:hypothetical protein
MGAAEQRRPEQQRKVTADRQLSVVVHESPAIQASDNFGAGPYPSTFSLGQS